MYIFRNSRCRTWQKRLCIILTCVNCSDSKPFKCNKTVVWRQNLSINPFLSMITFVFPFFYACFTSPVSWHWHHNTHSRQFRRTSDQNGKLLIIIAFIELNYSSYRLSYKPNFTWQASELKKKTLHHGISLVETMDHRVVRRIFTENKRSNSQKWNLA